MKKLILSVFTAFALLSFQMVQAADKIVFGTNWLAQGGHGGFYQAIADGTYKKHGLDVEISMGGPQMNNRPMLIAKKLDFLMTGNLLLSFDNVRNGIPTTVVAAFFQKDPQAMLIHEGSYSNFSDLTNAPTILVSKDGQFSYWKCKLTRTKSVTQSATSKFALAQVETITEHVCSSLTVTLPSGAQVEGIDEHNAHVTATLIECMS